MFPNVLKQSARNQKEDAMSKTLFATLALVIASTGFVSASTGPQFDEPTFKSTQDNYQQDTRRKKRVPGGSGCDDPEDYAEHAECRG
jgi:hypothetical protein